ncbi:MAG: hypothetical protein HUU47_07835 [Bacteroidetes bacterium]|nr:hypothetical protein [Bacteroidota bacterium]
MNKNTEYNEKLKSEKHAISSRENLTGMLPFVLFIAFILLLYIFFSHQTDKKIRKIEKLNKEVKELYSENITLQTEILNKTRSSSLEPLMLNYGIKPPVKQPIIIK